MRLSLDMVPNTAVVGSNLTIPPSDRLHSLAPEGSASYINASAIFSYSSAVFTPNSIPCRSKWRSREWRCLKGTIHRGFRLHLTIVHYSSPTFGRPEPSTNLRLCLPFRVPL